MFQIKGVIAEKFHPNGEFLRLQSAITMPLNTEAGVVRFIREQRPFKNLEIVEVETKEDKTRYFLALVKKEDERSTR